MFAANSVKSEATSVGDSASFLRGFRSLRASILSLPLIISHRQEHVYLKLRIVAEGNGI